MEPPAPGQGGAARPGADPRQAGERAFLQEGLCAALGLQPSPAQLDRLLGYLDLLQRWNATYNLTAVRSRADMLTQHLADCLAVVPPLQRHLAAHPARQAAPPGSPFRLLDVGSGGGLPGVVLAILMPHCQVSCVDTVGKKAAFVRQVAGALGLPNLQALHSRVEALALPPFDVITSRAFASLADFTALTGRLLAAETGVWMAMKGRPPQDELAAMPATVRVFHVEPLQVPGLDAERCLVWMRPAIPG